MTYNVGLESPVIHNSKTNNQRIVAIILSYLCWGTSRQPPPPAPPNLGSVVKLSKKIFFKKKFFLLSKWGFYSVAKLSRKKNFFFYSVKN